MCKGLANKLDISPYIITSGAKGGEEKICIITVQNNQQIHVAMHSTQS